DGAALADGDAVTAESSGSGAADAPIDPTDLEAASAMTPVDRERVSLDGLEFLFTSYCGEQIGNGVEILVLGLEPLEMCVFEIGGGSAFVQAIDERPGIQYISSTEPVYVIELPGESGTTVVELDGCE
ncbi:MAG: hypothetical protein ACO307_18665, partial [Ilumatobacteraceae bacterium]